MEEGKFPDCKEEKNRKKLYKMAKMPFF